MFSDTVSVFMSFGSAPVNLPLSEWITATIQGLPRHTSKVKRYRKTGKRYLKKSLPMVTVGAACKGGRAMENVQERTGWIALDIDSKDNPYLTSDEIKAALSNIVYVAFAGSSVSGKGVWALVRVAEPEKQASYYRQLQADFKSKGIVLDSTKGMNPNDARFYSFDPDAHLNKDYEIYDRLPRTRNSSRQFAHHTAAESNSYDTQSRVEALIAKIQSYRIDITTGYENWRDLGFALEDEFGEDGRNYFHEISQFNPEYSLKETDRQFNKCLEHSGSGIGIGTFFYRCKQHLITLI